MSIYTKTTFVNGGAPGISAEELNKMGDGIATAHSELAAHEARRNNPHVVTAAQIGAISMSNYTEVAPVAKTVSTAGVWEDWNLNAAHGVPGNALAMIMVQYLSSYLPPTVGVRTNGSGIERKLQMGDFGSLFFLTKTDASGIVEIFASATSAGGPTFYCLGWIK